jgi:DNA replication protein DnaC
VIQAKIHGAGKTHYATALGIAACMAGKSVLFVTVPNLVIELKEAMGQRQLTSYRRRFERFNLVILDELGYVSFDKTGCELLFNMLSNRHGKGSVIVTTNRAFDRWENVFADPVITGAMIDRLAHKAHILDISREQGGRFEETLAWIANGSSAQDLEGVGL